MEPIVLIGLVIVCYGGYVALLDLWREASPLLPRQAAKESGICGRDARDLQTPVKKMAGLYV